MVTDSDKEEYNEIEEWQMSNGNAQPEKSPSRRGPLPPPPIQDSGGPTGMCTCVHVHVRHNATDLLIPIIVNITLM